jgi:hypothetical protein
MDKAYKFVNKVIESCTKKAHLKGARNLILNFFSMYENHQLYDVLKRNYDKKMGEFEWF